MHRKISLKLLGQYTPWLHRIMDIASQGELKSMHRRLFHDLDFLRYIREAGGEDLATEALLHIIVDLEQYRRREERFIRY
ncbi:MAG: hypothetical protein QXT64_01570 [Desulfurococcaceae archaeon]